MNPSIPFPEIYNAADAYFRWIYRESVLNGTTIKKERDDYFAKMNIYTGMAHYVGKVLHIRPNEILDTWGVPELIVAYGMYTNEITNQNFEQWKHLSPEARRREIQPDQYNVKFFTTKDLEDG